MKKEMDAQQRELLEKYVLGEVSPKEEETVENWAAESATVRAELTSLVEAMEAYALQYKKSPKASLKNRVLHAVFSEGLPEPESNQEYHIPDVSEDVDLEVWEKLVESIKPPESYGNVFSHRLEKTPDRTTMVAWLKSKLPEEVHTKYIERFVILSGTCDCYFHGEKFMEMKRGDVMEIPLHVPHWIDVTSDGPLVSIIQRKAA